MAELGAIELEAADADDAALAFGREVFQGKPFRELEVAVKPDDEKTVHRIVHAL